MLLMLFIHWRYLLKQWSHNVFFPLLVPPEWTESIPVWRYAVYLIACISEIWDFYETVNFIPKFLSFQAQREKIQLWTWICSCWSAPGEPGLVLSRNLLRNRWSGHRALRRSVCFTCRENPGFLSLFLLWKFRSYVPDFAWPRCECIGSSHTVDYH